MLLNFFLRGRVRDKTSQSENMATMNSQLDEVRASVLTLPDDSRSSHLDIIVSAMTILYLARYKNVKLKHADQAGLT